MEELAGAFRPVDGGRIAGLHAPPERRFALEQDGDEAIVPREIAPPEPLAPDQDGQGAERRPGDGELVLHLDLVGERRLGGAEDPGTLADEAVVDAAHAAHAGALEQHRVLDLR